MLSNGHAGFGGRAWETDPEQSGHRAQARPNNLAEHAETAMAADHACLRAEPEIAAQVPAEQDTLDLAPAAEAAQAEQVDNSGWLPGPSFATSRCRR
ncbi:MAG TPA: hypothetical protein VGX25_10885 [Actinophytocola sp.]|uniref:hypothetical protein n=1 Tax=Actinophytocola sp. TaxID=1872138 RepID=UPI002DDCF155|nr:hypothetical protein [Actinophytocola sp.]HEV2779891.1 hypothetical protein [Actinophytocola sp.]